MLNGINIFMGVIYGRSLEACTHVVVAVYYFATAVSYGRNMVGFDKASNE
jgi:hypothetical protein